MDMERDEAVGAVSVGAGGRVWRAAVNALASEPMPSSLRRGVVELGAAGVRLDAAAKAYGARVVWMMSDAEERCLPVRVCRDWPEYAERAEALAVYEETKAAVVEMSRAWVEGRVSGTGGER